MVVMIEFLFLSRHVPIPPLFCDVLYCYFSHSYNGSLLLYLCWYVYEEKLCRTCAVWMPRNFRRTFCGLRCLPLSSAGMGWILDSQQSCSGFHSLQVGFPGESFWPFHHLLLLDQVGIWRKKVNIFGHKSSFSNALADKDWSTYE